MAFLLVVSACAGDVTESEEYVALESDLDAVQSELDTRTDELANVQGELATAQSDLVDAEEALGVAETSLSAAEKRADEAESALDAELNRPWPDEVKSVFVAGCAEAPEEDFTLEQQLELCECMVDELEESVGLTEFVVFSMATIDPNAEISPLTGLPRGIDERFMGIVTDAALACFLEI